MTFTDAENVTSVKIAQRYYDDLEGVYVSVIGITEDEDVKSGILVTLLVECSDMATYTTSLWSFKPSNNRFLPCRF